MTRIACLAVCTLTIGLPAATLTTIAGAQEVSPVDIHGFGGWAAGYTSNDNIYPNEPPPIASNDLEVNNYYFTLNLVARPTDKVVIHAQPTWESSMQGKRMQLDLAYVELTAVKDLRVRAGRIKNPLSLYTAIYKVGTLRPFYLLPNAYYRNAPESYAGIGLNRVQDFGSWELELDVLGGQMDFDSVESDMIVGFDPVAMKPQFASVPTALRGRDVVGGGLLTRLPVKGLQVGAAAYSMKLYASVPGGSMMRIGEERLKAYSGSAEYLTDKINLRAEALFARGPQELDAAYVEAAYYLTSHWQVAGSYERYNLAEPPPIVASLNKDRAFGFALNYWLNPRMVWKLNYYRVADNRVARTSDAVNRALAGTLPKDTAVLLVGVHFSF